MATFIHKFNEDLFTTYDVRGVAFEELTKEDAFYFGVAFANFLNKKRTLIQKLFSVLIGEKPKVVVGSDVLEENIEITEQFISGLVSCGVNVVDVGSLTAPAVYYSVSHFDCEAGVAITSVTVPDAGSLINLAQIRFVLNNEGLDGEEIKEFCSILEDGIVCNKKKGVINEIDILETYITEILSIIKFKPDNTLKVGVDCLDGSSGMILSKIIKKLPFKLLLRNAQAEGDFEKISPDPLHFKNIENLKKFSAEEGLDIAFSISGNGNRIAAVTKQGRILKGDELAFIIIKNFLENAGNKKNIVLDLAYSLELEKQINNMGGQVFFASTGQSEVRKTMKKVKAEIGVESKGHLYIKDDFYGYDDAIFAFLKIVSILSFQNICVDSLLSDFHFTFKTNEIRIKTTQEEAKYLKIKEFLIETLKPERIIEEEGVKLIFKNGKAAIMVRVCNTEDALSFKAEAFEIEDFVELEKLLEIIKVDFLK